MSRNVAGVWNVPQCEIFRLQNPPSADVAFILLLNALKWLESASKCMLNTHRSQNKRYFHEHGVSQIIAGHSNLPHCETFECPAMSRDIQMSRGNFFAQGPPPRAKIFAGHSNVPRKISREAPHARAGHSNLPRTRA